MHRPHLISLPQKGVEIRGINVFTLPLLLTLSPPTRLPPLPYYSYLPCHHLLNYLPCHLIPSNPATTCSIISPVILFILTLPSPTHLPPLASYSSCLPRHHQMNHLSLPSHSYLPFYFCSSSHLYSPFPLLFHSSLTLLPITLLLPTYLLSPSLCKLPTYQSYKLFTKSSFLSLFTL